MSELFARPNKGGLPFANNVPLDAAFIISNNYWVRTMKPTLPVRGRTGNCIKLLRLPASSIIGTIIMNSNNLCKALEDIKINIIRVEGKCYRSAVFNLPCGCCRWCRLLIVLGISLGRAGAWQGRRYFKCQTKAITLTIMDFLPAGLVQELSH